MTAKATNAPRVMPPLNLAALPTERLEAMHDAAEAVLRCEAALRRSGMSVITEVLRGQGDFVLWERFPKGDVFDAETHCQYFYHAHAPEEMADCEHGHFHLFMRPAGIAPALEPWALADAAPPNDPRARFFHICALSVDARGAALRLFVTNRWVTDETLHRADDMIALLDQFEIGVAHPNLAVSDWVSAMTRLFRPQIEGLLRLRDEVLTERAEMSPGEALLEDRALQNIAVVEVDVSDQIGEIERLLGV